MKKNATIRFYLNEHKSIGNQPKKIYLRVTLNRKKFEKFTGLKCEPKDWDNHKQRCKTNLIINQKLIQIERQMMRYEQEMQDSNKNYTLNDIKKLILKTENQRNTAGLLELFNSHIIHATENNLLTKERLIKYKAVYNSMVDFVNEKFNKDEMPLFDIDYEFITSYDLFLRNRKSKNSKNELHQNTIANYHKIVKFILKEIQNKGLIKVNPYGNFKIKIALSSRTYLTTEELIKIKSLNLENNESLDNIRDLFLFSVYTGIRFEDAQRLTIKNITEEKGTRYICFKQNKTSGETVIPMFRQVDELIEKLKNNKRKLPEMILPTISNQKANSYLHIIADLAGLQKTLTHHVARHTFATTILLENGVDIFTASKLLGHTSLKATNIYAKLTKAKLSQSIDRISNEII